VDSEEFSVVHRQVLRSKPMLRRLFADFYSRCRRTDEHYFSAPGLRIEIGSGSSFMKEMYPDVVTSDVKQLPFLDVVCRGEALPFSDGSVRALYGINVFHHLPSPRDFFRELVRVLGSGGGAVLIEPYHGPIARRVFGGLHASETFDTDAKRWETTSTGPMSAANQALSFIVFKRDIAAFNREFPQLTLLADEPHTHLRYIVSGGVNFRQLLPDVFDPAIVLAERVFAPLAPLLALQHTLVLRKS
jgi:SAM-dependent methyltransferase